MLAQLDIILRRQPRSQILLIRLPPMRLIKNRRIPGGRRWLQTGIPLSFETCRPDTPPDHLKLG